MTTKRPAGGITPTIAASCTNNVTIGKKMNITSSDHDDDHHHHVDSYYKSFPYSASMTEAPMFHLFFTNLFGGCKNSCCMQTIVSVIYKIRWMLSYPLRTRIVPHWVPYNWRIQITIGEVVLCAPMIYFFIEGYYAAFVSSSDTSIAVTGQMTSYVIASTYLSANKSNSFFTFLFGIPFERMISFHYLCSVCSIVL